jgi:hypothetical protein
LTALRSEERTIRVHFGLLRNGDAIGATLRRHGWRLHKTGAASYSAVRKDVVDQATARRQLHALGLLTSPALRIHFGLDAPLPPPQPFDASRR